MSSSRRGATLVELVVILFVVVVVVALVAVLLASLHASRIGSRSLENGTRIRGIHQGMVTFASDNKGYFPGMTGDEDNPFTHADQIRYWDQGGASAGVSVGARFAIMIESHFFTPDYLVSPYESRGDVVELDLSAKSPLVQEPKANFGKGIGPFNYSYALLEIRDTASATPIPNGAAAEWSDTLNSQAIVAGDRNIGTDAVSGPGGGIQSLRTKTPGLWQGNVVWNDNHVTLEHSPVPYATKYGQSIYYNDGTTPVADHLFTNDDGGRDCKLNIRD